MSLLLSHLFDRGDRIRCGALDGPGMSTGVEQLVGSVDVPEMFAGLGELAEPWASVLRRRACSSNKIFVIFVCFDCIRLRFCKPQNLSEVSLHRLLYRRFIRSGLLYVNGLHLFGLLYVWVTFEIAISRFLITIRIFPMSI